MEPPTRTQRTLIGLADLERSLGIVQERAAGPVAGIFGPGSVIWTVDREAAVFLGAGRALLLQLAHPWVATAIADHSSALTDPIGRFHRTFDVVFTMVFGSLENALQEARRLHRRHSAITGSLPDELTVGNADHAYFANELTALMWVHATLVDTALKTYELVMPPLSPEMRDQYFDECRLVGALFGIPLQVQPANWPAFTRWFDETSDRLTVGPAAERIGRKILKGAGRIPVPRWYLDLTGSLLPESLRDAFGLRVGPDEKRRAEFALLFFRVIYPRLNRRLRHVGPYQEALARISGRSRPDPVTTYLNYLWIGRSSIQK